MKNRAFNILFPLACLLHSALGDTCNSTTSNLTVTLWDSFGNGWGDTHWIVRNPAGDFLTYQPTCGDPISFVVNPCDNDPSNGEYVLTVRTLNDTMPYAYWEIYWSVIAYDASGDATSELVQGGYGTSMTWHYDVFSDNWEITTATGIVEAECIACSGQQCADRESNFDWTAVTNREPFSYGTPDTDLVVKMFDSASAWAETSPIGARWVISDALKTRKVETGSVCSGKSGSGCRVCLGDGSYVFRVTSTFETGDDLNNLEVRGSSGHDFFRTQTHITHDDNANRVVGGSAQSEQDDDVQSKWPGHGKVGVPEQDPDIRFHLKPDVEPNTNSSESPKTGPKPKTGPLPRPHRHTWEFCHARGSFGDELTFHISNGRCIPDNLRWAGETCDAVVNSTVFLNGIISLGGFKSEMFHSSDYELVLSSLAESVDGWSTSHMDIIDISLGAGLTIKEESSFVHNVEFKVSFVSEDYNVDGSLYGSVEILVAEMMESLSTATSSGEFIDDLQERANSAGSPDLAQANSSEVLSLQITSISYSPNRLEYSENKEKPDDRGYTKSISPETVAIIACVVGISLVMFMGMIFRSGKSTHMALPMSSESGHDGTPMGAIIETSSVLNPLRQSNIAHSFSKIPNFIDSERDDAKRMDNMKRSLRQMGVTFEELPAESDDRAV